MKKTESPEEMWRGYLEGTSPALKLERRIWRMLPSAPRCKLCHSPFGPPGSLLTRLVGKKRSPKNPNYCDMCYLPLWRFQGGAEVELTLLFADVRGSTTLAERMSPSEFSRILNRFYNVANHILIDTDALVDKLVGDEVIGLNPLLHARGIMERLRDGTRERRAQGMDPRRIRMELLGREGWRPVFTGGHFSKQNLIDGLLHDASQSLRAQRSNPLRAM